MSERDLLPCPFCGGQAKIGHTNDGEDCYVRCEVCWNGTKLCPLHSTAINLWNTRAALQQERGERVADERAAFIEWNRGEPKGVSGRAAWLGWQGRAALRAAPAPSAVICWGCGHEGDAPPAPALSCCPEREPISGKELWRRAHQEPAPSADPLALKARQLSIDSHETMKRIEAKINAAPSASDAELLAAFDFAIKRKWWKRDKLLTAFRAMQKETK